MLSCIYETVLLSTCDKLVIEYLVVCHAMYHILVPVSARGQRMTADTESGRIERQMLVYPGL